MLSEKHARLIERVDVTCGPQQTTLTVHADGAALRAQLTADQLSGLARQLWMAIAQSAETSAEGTSPPVPVDHVNMVVGRQEQLVVLEFHVGALRLPFILSAETLRAISENLPKPGATPKRH